MFLKSRPSGGNVISAVGKVSLNDSTIKPRRSRSVPTVYQRIEKKIHPVTTSKKTPKAATRSSNSSDSGKQKGQRIPNIDVPLRNKNKKNKQNINERRK